MAFTGGVARCSDSNSVPIACERDGDSAAVTRSFAIDITAALNPGAAIPIEDACVTGVAAVIAVVVGCSNRDGGAVAGERDRCTEIIFSGFTINVAANLIPGAAIPLEDARVP